MMNFTETAVKDHSAEQTEPQPRARPVPWAVRSHPGPPAAEPGTRMEHKRTQPVFFAQH